MNPFVNQTIQNFYQVSNIVRQDGIDKYPERIQSLFDPESAHCFKRHPALLPGFNAGAHKLSSRHPRFYI